MVNLAERIEKINPSITLGIAAKSKAMKAAGIDVIGLGIGEPDFHTPSYIQDAAIAAIKDGSASYYTPTAGLPALLEAIAKNTEELYQLNYDTDQIMVAIGAKHALYTLFQVLLNKGDEVIIPAPYWVSYPEQVRLAEGEPVIVQTASEHQHKITVAELEKARTPKTKAFILNSPSNPTGMIYTRDELAAIGEWAVEKDILIVSDDIYCQLVYNENSFVSIATISEAIKEQTIVINGLSKSYAMTGWRVGYAMGKREIIKAMIDVASHSTSNPTTVSQYAGIAALSEKNEATEQMRQAFEERLNSIYPQVAEIPGFELVKPQGAFYLFPKVDKAAKMCGYQTVDDFVDGILEEAHVAVVQGSGFGSPDYIRLSYAVDLELLEEAIARIHQFVTQKLSESE